MLATATALFAAAPASAQFFIKPANLAGARVTGAEPGMTGPALPGATSDELRAALVWNLRAALNVAALQCQFAPTLLTLSNYNAVLRDHALELRISYETLEKYFIRVNGKDRKTGQNELDRYGTRVYAGFSTVSSQYNFCQTSGEIGHDALFARRGHLYELAHQRMQELRNSLTPRGEQAFARYYVTPTFGPEPMPPFANKDCWRKNRYVEKKCGPLHPRWGQIASAGGP